MTQITRLRTTLLLLALLLLATPGMIPGAGSTGSADTYIVQAADLPTAVSAVEAVGGTVTHELGIIGGVGARLTPEQRAMLPAEVRTFEDGALGVAGAGPDTVYRTLVDADRAHAQGITGAGVTIAVIDTGLYNTSALTKNTAGGARLLAQYDAIRNTLVSRTTTDDYSGHGGHVAGIALSSEITASGSRAGVAPDANLVSIKAFDNKGQGSYLDVIRALDWVVSNRQRYNIRVLNLSLSAPPQSFYWEDPLNQAVMRAWQAGIVVVAAAGNKGPNAMSIGVPGNVPYVITVGAMTDKYTPADRSDDIVASFSSAGPTVEGFVKPEVVAPGGHVIGLMDSRSDIYVTYPQFQMERRYFQMSGTSQATAVTSGVVALMLQANPALTPDDVKCRLMASARPALKSSGELAFSIFQQGAGLVNALDAINSTATGCANVGLNIANDLNNVMHYGGRANRNVATGDYYVMDMSTNAYVWSGAYTWSSAYVWSGAYTWSQAYTWSSAYVWSGAYTWSQAYVWSGAYTWSAATMSINSWVPQE